MPILQWLNREETLTVGRKVPYKLLEEDKSLSYGDNSDNMIIQGDNLDALKALMPYYKGQVKCVFIDPPYNTKSAFEHYDDNLEHSKWLHMMYPRLELLRELLREDGSIWISIDDNEAHYLKVIMDEIFGRKNFVANVVWQKKYAVANDHKTIAPMHDHILVFQKSELWKRNLLPRTEEKDRQYKYEDELGIFRPDNYTCNKTSEERPNLYYPIVQPTTGEEIWPSKTRVWSYSQEEHKRHIDEDLIYWGKDGKGKVPSFKRYKHMLRNQGIVPQSLWSHEFAGHTDASRKEVREVLDTSSLQNDFLTPKPEKLIQQVLTIATASGDLVIDSFLGSGTTAAVAQKMGRRYIGIELGDHAVTHVVQRINKVVDGEQGGISKSVEWQGGGGFRFYRLGEAVFDDTGRLNSNVKFPALAAHIWFTETRTSYTGQANSPLLGIHEGVAYYLLYNGILGDKRPDSGNVLTMKVLNSIPEYEGEKVIYGEASRLGEARQKELNITFKQTPYDIKFR